MRTSFTHLVAGDIGLKQDNSVLQLNNQVMSRIRQNQNIDSLIQSITSIAEDRCSLSVEDLNILDEASNLLKNLKRKKGKSNEEILQIVVKVVELLSKFFKDDFED